MIVCKREDFSNALIEDEPPQYNYPTLKIILSVDHRLIPGRRLFLNALAIPEPTDISKISGNQVRGTFHFPRPRHERRVRQRQGNVVLTKQIGQSGVEPVFVTNLDREATGIHVRRSLEEGLQTSAELVGTLEHPLIELGKLEKYRAELVAQQVHSLDELIELRLTIH